MTATRPGRRAAARTNLRAIIYVRVSSYNGPTDSDDRRAATASPEIQAERCRAMAAAKGWTVVDVVYDLDVSGSRKGDRLNRPGLVECRNAVRDGRADVILSLRLDRLARNARDLLELAEEVEDNGGGLTVVEGGVDTTDRGYGKLILTVLGAIAELEAYSITSRTMSGKYAALEAGRWIGTRRPPMGFVKIPHPEYRDGWTLAIEPERAAIVRSMATAILAGQTPYQVTKDLNARSVPTQSGRGKWTVATVRALLMHPAMVGRFNFSGEVLRGEDGMPRQIFPALIDVATWHTLTAKLGKPRDKENPGPANPAQFLLSGGVARCGTCGGSLSQNPSSDGQRRYRCSRQSKGACAKGVSAPMIELDEMVTSYFLDTYGHFPLTHEVTVTIDDPDRAEVLDAINRLESVRIDPRVAGYRELRDARDAQLSDLLNRLDALPEGPQTVTRIQDTGETIADVWARSFVNERRALLLRNVRAVVSRAGRLPGSGHFDPDLSKRVDLRTPEEFALMMTGDASAIAAAEIGPDEG
jgi:DNA invertase Pin-like site-specific DNA recombinase